MNISITAAAAADAPAIAALRTLVARDLARKHGIGPWCSEPREPGVLRGIVAPVHTSRVLVARDGDEVVGTLRLATKKPWAIDPAYFKPVKRAIYLHDMAVMPDRQRHGVGRRLILGAISVAKAWPAESIRLDAYDSAAGAGPFYAKCGFTGVGRVTYRTVPLIYFEIVL